MSRRGSTIIKAARIFSPAGERAGKKYVFLKDGLIEAVSSRRPDHSGADFLDFSGYSVSPLFCDYHLHFSGTASADSEIVARALLNCGIHRVAEGGDSQLSGLEMQQLLKNRVEVRRSGYAIYKKGTYGKHIGHEVEGPDDAIELIDYLCNLRVDYIKIINSGIVLPETGAITPGGFEKGELIEIIRYVKRRGMDCFCHANGDERIREAVLAGAAAIIHGFYISDEILELMADYQTAFIPTVNAFACLSAMVPAPALQSWEDAVGRHLRMVKKAEEKGVKILPGSDSGPEFIPYGTSYLRELQLFKKAGIPTDDILSSACTDQLTAGSPADFLVLDGLKIKKVFLSGERLIL